MKYQSFILASFFSLFFSTPGLTKNYRFEPSLLGPGVDVEFFDNGGQLPGAYYVDVLLNGEKVDSREVIFYQVNNIKGGYAISPCLTISLLSSYRVKVDKYPGLSSGNSKSGINECANLAAIPEFKIDFQLNKELLLLTVPQADLTPKIKGIASRELWDDGINAAFMNYSANANRIDYKRSHLSTMDSQFIKLSPGANLGSWRLRNSSTWQKSGNNSGQWQATYTYAEHGFYDSKSRVTLGERSTSADIFDSVPFRGVMLESDDLMVPYTQRSFTPSVSGIARTQARVEVRQNNYTIYDATVPQGEFLLSDLSLNGGVGNDLEVIIHEADGSKQSFTVPYSTPAIAVRQGYLKYNIMTGQYRAANSDIHSTPIGQATVIYGLPWDLTVYGGVQFSEYYQANSLGLGMSLGELGALSADGITAHGNSKGMKSESGHIWRLRYNKSLKNTSTGFTLASYYYTSKGYDSLSGILDTYRKSDSGDFYNKKEGGRNKTRTSLTLNQPLGIWGYATLYGSRSDSWDSYGYDNSFGLSYGIGIKSVSLSINWTENQYTDRTGEQRSNRLTSLVASIPFGQAGTVSYRFTSPDIQELGIAGNGFDQQLSWGMQQRLQAGSNSNNSALNMSWLGGYGRIRGNYNHSTNARQIGMGVYGGGIIHENGITLSQPLDGTTALVEVPSARSVAVNGAPGIKTDFRGFTTRSNLIPYQKNRIFINPNEFLDSEVEILKTDMIVIPTSGAIIPAKFSTRVGAKAIITLIKEGGRGEIPFGAIVTLEGENSASGVVGAGSQVYMTGLPKSGQLLVKWGDSQQEQCRVKYKLPNKKDLSDLYSIQGGCR